MLKTRVKFLDLVRVLLLALLTVSEVAFHVVLIEFHESREIFIFIFSVYNLLNILLELENDSLLFTSALFLGSDLSANLVDSTLNLPKACGVVLQLGALVLKVFLELE